MATFKGTSLQLEFCAHVCFVSSHVSLTVPAFFLITFWPGQDAKNSLCSSTLRSSHCILDSNCTHRGEAVRAGCLLEVEVILTAFLQGKKKKVKTLLSRPFFHPEIGQYQRDKITVYVSCYCSKKYSTKVAFKTIFCIHQILTSGPAWIFSR